MSTSIKFDVIVVGAGPAGSTVAQALARALCRVALLEEHTTVGVPNHCSGLVSPRVLEMSGVPDDAVTLRRFDRARVWGPGDGTLWLRGDSVRAIAIARERFDQLLAGRAASAGAALMLATKARRFERVDGHIRVTAGAKRGELQLEAPPLIGADGAGSRVARWMGAHGSHEVIPAAKADVAFSGRGTETVEILAGNALAPGWFGWVIPVSKGRARIGLGATGSLPERFAAFLEPLRQWFGDFSLEEVRRAPIPLGPARGFVGDGVMLVGAAARQTKPTTGGGLYLALRAAQALEQGDHSRQALAAYEQAWHQLEGHELVVGHWLRQAFRRLSDRELDRILTVLAEPWAQNIISRLGDIDFPAQLLSSLLRGVVGRIPSLSREVVG
jgi:digeranylgeranylglycerophospholipid reductase